MTDVTVARLLAISADAIILIDDAQRIIEFNRGAEEIFGWSAAEIVGSPLNVLLPARFRDVHTGHMLAFRDAPETARRMGERRQIFGLRRSGEEFPAEASIAKLDAERGRVYSVVLRDVTERKRTEAELRDATRAREAILGVVAHDLRSPLSGIALCTRALLADPSADEATRGELVSAIDQAVGWMDRMIADLLDVSHIESGHLSVELVAGDLGPVIAAAVVQHQRLATENRVALWLDAPPSLPPVLHDAERIVQVLSNLLGNALKFTPEGGEVVVQARFVDAEQAVVVGVSDTGPGIPAERRSNVFAPYWQHRRTGAPRGTGLGLAIVKGIIDAHGGRVWVDDRESDVDGRTGTRVSFALPTAPA